MRDEASVLFGLTHFGIQLPLLKGWAGFLTGVLHSSSYRPNSMSLQHISMGPTCFLASWAFLVESIWFGGMETEQQS
jgi:hypothetical protein